MAELKVLRIFVSSPGDVAEERALAEGVLRRLGKEYRSFVQLELVLWEHEPVFAHTGYQQQIAKPSECDLVICILWSKLGTRLPEGFAPGSGEPAPTGTEYEIRDALEGYRVAGKPNLLIYRKSLVPQLNITSAEARERLRQIEELDDFCRRTFYDQHGAIIVAHTSYADSPDFERKLLEHVRRWLAVQLGHAPPKSRRQRNVLAAGIILVAVALAYFAADRLWLSKRLAADHTAAPVAAVVSQSGHAEPAMLEKSIAVLPFADMSEKKDQEYFADGMAEEILDILAKVPSLKVIGRTSSFQFKGRNEDLRTIGTSLGVAYVLEGSVRRTADRVRVTAQLIDARDGSHVWSETYDRPANDALLMQDEIATTLSRSLEIGIGADRPQSDRRLKNDTAYDLYLRGRYAAERGDADGMATGIIYLRQALDADPTFADAEVALALTYYNQAFQSLEPSGVFELARHAAESALKLNPQLGLAHAVLGGIHNDYDWQWDAAAGEFKQAIALAPHDGRVLTIASDLTIALGQLDAARRTLKQALAYDPLLADAYASLVWTEWCSGHYADMLEAARKTLEIDPTYDWGHTNVGLALIYRGDPAAAITEIQRESNPIEEAWGLALAYEALGRAADSNAALKKLITGGAANYAYEIAEVYAYRGQRDEALKWLERAYVQKDGSLKWIALDPSMARLESDPRYKVFLHKMNLPE